ELVAILSSPEGDYQPAALEAAKRVFDSRNLPEQKIVTIRNELKEKQIEDERKANEPLETRYKVIAFLFPRMYYWLPDEILDEAYVRKSRELTRWHFYGMAFYISIILMMVLLELPH
ncbi:MAG: hypothetical protein JST32_08860, partial [Bacteroidetes bacterium]|nr:hypothetical protein [Bacteroidota bacterium]